jgi:hypothetical protein
MRKPWEVADYWSRLKTVDVSPSSPDAFKALPRCLENLVESRSRRNILALARLARNLQIINEVET